MSSRSRVVVVGAGFGGLACAVELAAAGHDVCVLEREVEPGGKAATVTLGARSVAVGPTVLTMRDVFDGLFRRRGKDLEDFVKTSRQDVIARHAFADQSTLDLFSDVEQSAQAIARLCGEREGNAYRRFVDHARKIADTVNEPFLHADRPTLGSLLRQASALGLGALGRIDAHRSMWRALESFFSDPRLIQLFGRYATYVGSSPFDAPGTFNLVSHVEREGVFRVAGGMPQLAWALVTLAKQLGVRFEFGWSVVDVVVERGVVTGVVAERGDARETFAARAVVANCDVSSVAAGVLGAVARSAVSAPKPASRSLSALTWAVVGSAGGFPLLHHNVFFSSAYRDEFTDLFEDGVLPRAPTVYVCAQDRGDEGTGPVDEERFFIVVNAPATADREGLGHQEIDRCERAMLARLARAGLTIVPSASVTMGPHFYETKAPGTGGAIYGPSAHGALAPMSRASAKTKLPGLFLAGGSVHPGPGVPMAALSGITAARAVASELASTSR